MMIFLSVFFYFLFGVCVGSEPVIFDEFVPNECPRFAKPSDHLIM